MHRIFYRVTLEEPAIFSTLEGEPNSAVSYDYIPGSVIRGMLIGEYLADPIDNYTDEFSTHPNFFSDDVMFLNATIAIDDGNGKPLKTYPNPTTWHKLKYADDGNIYDNAIQLLPQGQKASSVNGYTYTHDNVGIVVSPKRILNVHTQRRRRGSIEQLVYRYDALAKDQVFVGEIRCRTEDQLQDIHRLLENVGRTSIGGARSAGYGQVWVEVLQDTPGSSVDYVFPYETDRWVLTFLSDAILRDSTGKFSSSTDTLMSVLADNGIIGDVEMALLSTRMVGGFNRKWGLPLPQMPAIQQGSVLVLGGVKKDETKINTLLSGGIGERRNEGFGQIAINWQQRGELERIKEESMKSGSTSQNFSKSDSDAMTAVLTARLEAQRLNSDITGIVYGRESAEQYQLYGTIASTQIARLRNIIRDELRNPTPDRSVISKFLDETIKGKVAEKQFDDARLGSTSLSRWLRQLLQDKMADVTLLNFIDAVLDHAQKSARQQEQQENE